MVQQLTLQERHILEQSFDFITREGVRSFTVDSLAQKLGMSKKTIYKFFPTKEVLIEKSVEFFTGLIERRLKNILETEPNPAKQFMSIMQFIIKRISQIQMERVADLKTRYPQIWKKFEAFRLARRDDFYTILSEAQKQGYIRQDIDVKVVATLYMSIVISTFQPEFFIKNNLSAPDTVRTFLKMITGGLFTDRGMKYVDNVLNKNG